MSFIERFAAGFMFWFKWSITWALAYATLFFAHRALLLSGGLGLPDDLAAVSYMITTFGFGLVLPLLYAAWSIIYVPLRFLALGYRGLSITCPRCGAYADVPECTNCGHTRFLEQQCMRCGIHYGAGQCGECGATRLRAQAGKLHPAPVAPAEPAAPVIFGNRGPTEAENPEDGDRSP